MSFNRRCRRCCSLASVLFVCLGASGPAQGEHIELTFIVGAVPGDIVTALGGGVAIVIFDTDAPPLASDVQTVTFGAAGGRIDAVLFEVDPVTNPSAANAAPVSVVGEIESAELIYSQVGDPNIIVRLTLGDATATLTVFSPAGAFSPAMLSLPDAPEDYVVADKADFRVFGNVLADGLGVFASINRQGAFVSTIGGVSYNARLVDPPTLPPCNEADLAEPFGMLDFDDVLVFLTGFAGGELIADLAEPTCVFDFDDVLAFLIAFGAGCP